MTEKRAIAFGGAFVTFSLFVSVYALSRVPDQVVVHWNTAGQPDATMSKFAGLMLLPFITAVVVGALAVLPRIDPRGENYEAFRPYYDGFVVAIAGYLSLVHLAVVAYNLGYAVDVMATVVGSLGLLLYYAGIVLAHAEPNWFLGIRTPWTLSSDRVWHATHRLGSRLFKLSGVLALLGVFYPDYALYLLIGPLVATALVTGVYSLVKYRQLGADGSSVGD